MTTHRELATAFFSFEDSPRTASNMEVRQLDDHSEILVGGDEWIYAIRRPIQSVAHFSRFPRYSRQATITRGWAINQRNTIRNVAERHSNVSTYQMIPRRPPKLSHDGINEARNGLEEIEQTPTA